MLIITEETYTQVMERMKREEESLPNQLAVIGYLKLTRIEHYLASTLEREEYLDLHRSILGPTFTEVHRDIHIDALGAALNFLLFDHDWKE